ncbi:hypothetical protein JAAARDRAFT_188713 [Jaapia argillacea MUCL 33604]|uniref:Enoyl reductase (ER) domain-containing protein n=1 Tax=Jaapia argillacea MUCL 33604 TaxID=933084 RepID=A0A067Q7S4_9AGAM|nr:hypothetical protein JAAARDRAFT_188713 [Jaapia argillacea MUCL 33604]
MKALVYNGTQGFALEERPIPQISSATDAIVRLAKTTICGTDLHILHGDIPSAKPGLILGHEGVGTVETVGSEVNTFKPGDRVIISCITSCSTCDYCRRSMPSHCTSGGPLLGHIIDGTHAEFVRIPYADFSLHKTPVGVDDSSLVMVSDTLPTALECGVIPGKVQPGSSVAIIGAGPIGLSTVIISQLYEPSMIIVINRDKNRLQIAKKLGATHIVEFGPDAARQVLDITGGRGADTVIEAAGVPATFELCQEIVAVGGTIANVGVHGSKADLHLEKLWHKNIVITSRLVDTVTCPKLIELLASGSLVVKPLATHTFKFGEIEQAYSSFASAAANKAIKMIIDFE